MPRPVVAIVLLGFAFVVGPLPRPWSGKLVYVVGDIAIGLWLRDMRSNIIGLITAASKFVALGNNGKVTTDLRLELSDRNCKITCIFNDDIADQINAYLTCCGLDIPILVLRIEKPNHGRGNCDFALAL
ncbi:hypothetical protein RIF29_27910 [Crotalaria pallida]|uniref:Uncharacterized protein n=1 Tax=Crotalaria pallida TaxID=3830 RepID=A0AAN9I623_CROPI